MIHTVILYALLGELGLIVLHLAFVGRRRPKAGPTVRAEHRLRGWDRLVYGAVIASVAVLARTGLWPAIGRETMSGLALLVHNGAGPVFAIGLVALALSWADRCRFGRGQAPHGGKGGSPERFGPGQKVLFWVMVLGGLTTIGSIMLSMVPVFDTPGLCVLAQVHRVGGLVVVMATLGHLYLRGLTAWRG